MQMNTAAAAELPGQVAPRIQALMSALPEFVWDLLTCSQPPGQKGFLPGNQQKVPSSQN